MYIFKLFYTEKTKKSFLYTVKCELAFKPGILSCCFWSRKKQRLLVYILCHNYNKPTGVTYHFKFF